MKKDKRGRMNYDFHVVQDLPIVITSLSGYPKRTPSFSVDRYLMCTLLLRWNSVFQSWILLKFRFRWAAASERSDHSRKVMLLLRVNSEWRKFPFSFPQSLLFFFAWWQHVPFRNRGDAYYPRSQYQLTNKSGSAFAKFIQRMLSCLYFPWPWSDR